MQSKIFNMSSNIIQTNQNQFIYNLILFKKKMTDRDYYLDMAINAAIEYVQKKEGIELEGKDRQRYKSIIIDDEEFHVFAFFKYGLLIDYDKDTDELLVNELEGVRSGKYDKEVLSFLKSSIDRFGSLEEFQKEYKEFKNANNTKVSIKL